MSTTETSLIQQFAKAQRDGSRAIDATTLRAIDIAAAYRIQAGTRAALGEGVGMIKAGIYADGTAAAAPIYASRLGHGTGFTLPADRVVGLEVEVGLVLKRDVAAGATEADVAAAVDHYFAGIEIVGTRFADRGAAGPYAGLADNMSALGYVVGPRWTRGTDVDGVLVTLELAGQSLWSAPAATPAGRPLLASVVAYAAAQNPDLPLKAGLIVTTGSLCGLVASSGAGHVIGRLDDTAVELDLV